MTDDRARWDERWAARAPGEPAPPEALEGRTQLAPRSGRALDVACGQGATSVWAAERGLDVVGVDVSPVAIGAARRLADAHGVADRCAFVVHDLAGGLPDEAAGPFDLVICQRFRDPMLYGPLRDRVAEGGLLVVTVLSAVGRADTTGRFLAAPGELVAAAEGMEVLRASEADGVASVVARRARRAG